MFRFLGYKNVADILYIRGYNEIKSGQECGMPKAAPTVVAV